MNKENLQDFFDETKNGIKEHLNEIPVLVIGAVAGDVGAIMELTSILTSSTYTAIQKIPYLQLKRYLDGVKRIEDDYVNAVSLSSKLFTSPHTRNDNALRVYKMVSEAETEKKINQMVDATRSFLLGMIDTEALFRVFRAITSTLPEDLEYLMGIIGTSNEIRGNINIHALERSGLVISAGNDYEADFENQLYAISELGYMVDRFSLSIDDDERQNWYRERDKEVSIYGHNSVRVDESRRYKGVDIATDEEVEKIIQEGLDDL